MNAMRPAVLFFVALVFIPPAGLFAAEKFDPKALTGSADKCLDEKLAIVDGRPVLTRGRTDTERYKTCAKPPGCSLQREKAKECVCGRMVYTTLEKKQITLDKCDPDMQKKLAQAVAGGAEGMQTFATQAIITDRIEKIDVSTESGRGQLSQILQSYGVPQAEADAKVNDADKAADVQAQLQKFVSTSDTDEAKKVAEDLGFKLNADLTDEVRLDPKNYSSVFTKEELAEIRGKSSSTFPESPDAPVRLNIAAALTSMCGQRGMGGCGYVCNLPNQSLLTCAANNPGALTFTPWQTRFGGRPCGLNNNTTCFDTIEGGIAAQANLLTTSARYFGSGNNTILGAFCNGYSTSNCAQYASFIAAQTGIPMNQTIDPKNTQQIAAIMMASSRFENGRGVIYTPDQLQRGLEVAFGNEKLPEGTPGYIARTVFGTNGGAQFGSMFSTRSSSAAPATIGYGSAFGSAAPAPLSQPAYSQPTVASVSPTIAPSTPSSQTQSPLTGSSTVAQQLQQALQNPNGTGALSQSPANVVAQPKEVQRGNPVTVSWTSIGMSPDTPCVLRANSTLIAEGNQGSKVVPTTEATRTGSLVFTLTCTTVSGTTIQRTAATFVR